MTLDLSKYIGVSSGPPFPAPVAVNEAMIRHWCEAMGDTNPRYANEAPPTMLLSWAMPGYGKTPAPRLGTQGELMALLDEAGFTSVVATDNEEEYARYLRPGDHVTMTTVIEDVSEEKKTGLGVGHFVTTLATFTTDEGEVVGTHRFRILKYKPVDRQTQEPAPPRPPPAINRDNQFFWEGTLEGELRIQRCTACKTLRHPPGPGCPHCRSLEWDYIVASGNGTVYSYVTHHYPPMPQFGSPHNVILVELEEGVRFVSNLVDESADITIGMPVRLVFTKIAEGYVLPQFEAV